VIVGTDESTWSMLAPKDYLDKMLELLREKSWSSDTLAWEQLAPELKDLDEEYTKDLLSTTRLLDMYDSPYSRLLAVSFYSLFHLEGTMLEYLVALSKDTYETRGKLDVVVEVEGEPGNYVRVPWHIAEKLKERGVAVKDRGATPASALKPHDYIRRGGDNIKARGLVIESN